MSAALEQQRDLPSKHVASEELDREPSPEKPGSNSRSSTSNGVDSTGHSRGGTPDQRRRSPSSATQEAASTLVQMSNTQPLAKQNSQSPKKPSTPVQKRESVEEVADKFVSLSTNSPKHQPKSNDQQNILSNRDDALTCNVNNKKRGAGFRTDREYLNGEGEEGQDLVEWQSDPEHEIEIKNVLEERGKRGWAPDEMFRANDKLGVQSTFNGIAEYSNAMPEGDDEARREADRIAAEIEGNKDSRRYALLENDDEERDLDKETRFNDRDGGRGSKRQSGGFQTKGNRSQFNSGTSGGRNYSNSPRNSYPNTGSNNSLTNTGSNRYTGSGSQSRQQRSSFAPNYSSSNAPPKQAAPTTTSWRTESPQQQPAGQQLSYAKPAVKSPTLSMEERRQSASPAAPKYNEPNSTASVRRTNSVQNRQQQQPSYSPRPDVYAQEQVDRRVPDNRYHDGSSSTSSVQPPVSPHALHRQSEIQPLITPIPRPAPTPQGSYDNQQQYVQQEEKPKKNFTFNPDAAVFVPRSAAPKTTPTPSATPVVPMQSVIPAQSAVMTNVSHYSNQPVMPMNFIGIPQTPLLVPQQPVFQQQPQMSAMQGMPQQVPSMQQIAAQQRVYQPGETINYVDSGKLISQQQKYAAANPMQIQPMAHSIQYVQQQAPYQQQTAQVVVPTQMQMNGIPHPQFSGTYNQTASMVPAGSLSYHNAPAMIQPQQGFYQPTYSYSNGQ